MDGQAQRLCTAFEGVRCIASGELAHVAAQAKAVIDRGPQAPLLIFDAATSEPIDLDWRGGVEEVVARLSGPEPAAPEVPAAPRGRGRPKLGVVAREVTLLPRHWDWLNRQPGGASVSLRRLVDEARKVHEGKDRRRQAQEAAYRFMSAMGGDLPGFEEATRALFAGDEARFEALVDAWPEDVAEHTRWLAAKAFGEG